MRRSETSTGDRHPLAVRIKAKLRATPRAEWDRAAAEYQRLGYEVTRARSGAITGLQAIRVAQAAKLKGRPRKRAAGAHTLRVGPGLTPEDVQAGLSVLLDLGSPRNWHLGLGDLVRRGFVETVAAAAKARAGRGGAGPAAAAKDRKRRAAPIDQDIARRNRLGQTDKQIAADLHVGRNRVAAVRKGARS